MSLAWVTAYLDSPPETAARSEVFWAALTGWTLSERRGLRAEFATLLPQRGDAFLRVQEVRRSVPGALHLDLHTDDVGELAERAERLGASTSYPAPGLVVCGSPGGLSFCVVGHPGRQLPEAGAWPGGRSLVDQVCLDIPPRLWARETTFWSELTGWPRRPAGEFERLTRPEEGSMPFLLQRLDDEQSTVTAHLDLSCDDREHETARQQALGAEVVGRSDAWTVLRDPAGRTYCLTTRVPGSV